MNPFLSGLTCAADGPLLNGTLPVPDSFFTASSEYSATYAAHKARLDGSGSWWGPTVADKTAIPITVYLQVGQVYIKYLLLTFFCYFV